MSNERLGIDIKEVVIIPAGKKAKQAAENFERVGVKILCMCDNDENVQNKPYKGIPIISVEEAAKTFSTDYFYLAIMDSDMQWKLRRQLIQNGVAEDKIREYQYHEYAERLPESEYPEEIKRIYEQASGKKLDYNNVRTFNEKVQWLSAYDRNPLKTKLADKYAVREWVGKLIGSKYLIPLLGVWDRFDEIDFSVLPSSFVLKCNHGCGYNIIVRNKDEFDIENAKIKIEKWMKENYAFKAYFEPHYKNIIPKIICEKYLENNNSNLYDYKFHCFNGRPEYVYIVKNRNKEEKVKERNYDIKWNPQEFTYNNNSLEELIDEKPEKLDEMISIAEKLSADFKYVRVDLYYLNNNEIKFGEMTFTPCGGMAKWNPEKYDIIMGEKIRL